MKPSQEMPTTFDRMSTREELHQVLDLLTKYPWATGAFPDGGVTGEEGPDPGGSAGWHGLDSAEELESLSDTDFWPELLLDKPEHIN